MKCSRYRYEVAQAIAVLLLLVMLLLLSMTMTLATSSLPRVALQNLCKFLWLHHMHADGRGEHQDSRDPINKIINYGHKILQRDWPPEQARCSYFPSCSVVPTVSFKIWCSLRHIMGESNIYLISIYDIVFDGATKTWALNIEREEHNCGLTKRIQAWCIE